MTDHSPTALELLAHHPPYADTVATIQRERRRWLITGGAGFIGSHLAETLLDLDQEVVVLDDLSRGTRTNLAAVRAGSRNGARHLAFVHGDVRDDSLVRALVRRVDVVLHQAAHVGTPDAIDDPVHSHDVNVTGFLGILDAARTNGTRVLYAASHATDDDAPTPKHPSSHPHPRSMHTATKTASEAYAAAYHATYGVPTIGLRYGNVYGARQDPNGPHATAIPTWIAAMRRGEPCTIHGDGLTRHDVCHVANVVGANLLASLNQHDDALGSVLDVGAGHDTTLLTLHDAIADAMQALRPGTTRHEPTFTPYRDASPPRTPTDVTRARDVLGYEPIVGLSRGIELTVAAALTTPLPAGPSQPRTRLAIPHERVDP